MICWAKNQLYKPNGSCAIKDLQEVVQMPKQTWLRANLRFETRFHKFMFVFAFAPLLIKLRLRRNYWFYEIDILLNKSFKSKILSVVYKIFLSLLEMTLLCFKVEESKFKRLWYGPNLTYWTSCTLYTELDGIE